nr:hypothetical protein Q903MT_gene3679 [Picea sitchensis]
MAIMDIRPTFQKYIFPLSHACYNGPTLAIWILDPCSCYKIDCLMVD